MKKRLLALALAVSLVATLVPTFGSLSVQAAINTPTFGSDDASFVETESGYELSLNGQWKVSACSETKDEINTKPYELTKDLNTLTFLQNPAKPSEALDVLVEVPSSLNAHETFAQYNKVVYSSEVALKNIGSSSFYIDFDGTNWVTSVFVNGQYAGGKIGTRMPWNCDITNFVDAGKEKQLIQIVVKSTRYAIDAIGTMQLKGDTFKDKTPVLSDFIDIPWNDTSFGSLVWLSTISPSSKGDHDGAKWGITDALSIVATSKAVKSAYVDDIFVNPNVVDKNEKKVTKTRKVKKTKYVKNKKGKKVKKTVTVTEKYKVTQRTFTKNKKFTTQVTVFNPTTESKTVTVVPSVQTVDLEKKDGKLTSKKVYGANESIPGLTEQSVTLAAGEKKVVEFKDVAWDSAELWWPDLNYDTAQMYNFKATVKDGANVSSVYNQQFGFRDVETDGTHIRINGVIRDFWNALGSLGGNSLEDILKNMKDGNNRFERFGSDIGLAGTLQSFYGYTPNPSEQMDVLDFLGIPMRVCSMIDGMSANLYPYRTENTEIGVKAGINEELFKNYQIQIEDMVKEHRNHPANIVYSLENEFMYITVALVFKTRTADIEKAVMQYMATPCTTLDPSRPYMLDGGGASMNDEYPIFCHHYAEEQGIVKNSEKVTLVKNKSQALWQYKEDRPYAGGEVAYFSGEFDTHAWIGGSDAGNSQGDALVAYAKYMKTLYNKYRWNDVAITCPWTTSAGTKIAHPALDPLAVIRENYTSTFFASKGMTFKVKVMNDTFSDGLITAKWSLIDPKTNQAIQTGTFADLSIEPGTGVVKTVKIGKIPNLAERTDFIFRLESSQATSKNSAYNVDFEAAKPFSEDQTLSAYPAQSKISLGKKIYTYNTNTQTNKYLKSIGVKTMKVKPYLKSKVVKKKKGKIVYKKVKNKKTGKITKVKQFKIKKTYMSPKNYKKSFLKKKGQTVLVGNYGVHSEPGYGDQAALSLYARAGGRVIYLEQNKDNMLCGEADGPRWAPIKLYTYVSDSNQKYAANYTFGQGFDRPLLSGLEQSDLSMWNGAGKTTEVLWGVPTGSATSWITANGKMNCVALLEIPCDKGQILATQLRIGAKIAVEPAAQLLLKNMLTYAKDYEIPSGKVGILNSTKDYLKTKMAQTGVVTVPLNDIKSGLSLTATKIMLIEANEANLVELNNNKEAVEAYVNGGGWIMFTNLTDDQKALDQYNALLGTKHIVRPFRLESTNAFADWTTIGLSTSDYKLYSRKMIAEWSNLSDISPYTWSYAVDATNDITPFFDYEGNGHGNEIDNNTINDRRYNAANICNYLSADEHWYYMSGHWYSNDQFPTVETPSSFAEFWTGNKDFFTLRHEEKLDSITYRQAATSTIAFSGMNVIVNDQKVVDNHPLELSGTEQKIDLNGISANKLDVQFTGIYPDEMSNFYNSFGMSTGSMAGIQEMHINRQTPQWITDAKVKALNSSGTLVKYERGKGGFILNNARLDTDAAGYKTFELSTSINKKVAIFTKIFTNLGAAFTK